jgi:DNA excision repair protein ERCC-3
VLAASETECEEEREGGVGGGTRRAGALSSLAGADDALYLERRNAHNKHPLFKKFRY